MLLFEIEYFWVGVSCVFLGITSNVMILSPLRREKESSSAVDRCNNHRLVFLYFSFEFVAISSTLVVVPFAQNQIHSLLVVSLNAHFVSSEFWLYFLAHLSSHRMFLLRFAFISHEKFKSNRIMLFFVSNGNFQNCFFPQFGRFSTMKKSLGRRSYKLASLSVNCALTSTSNEKQTSFLSLVIVWRLLSWRWWHKMTSHCKRWWEEITQISCYIKRFRNEILLPILTFVDSFALDSIAFFFFYLCSLLIASRRRHSCFLSWNWDF